MAKFSAWITSSAQEPSENRLCKRIYQSLDAAEHMTETSLQITQLKSSRTEQEHTEMHWKCGPRDTAVSPWVLRAHLLLFGPLQALPLTTMQHPLRVSDRNQPEPSPQWTMVTSVPRKEQSPRLYYHASPQCAEGIAEWKGV